MRNVSEQPNNRPSESETELPPPQPTTDSESPKQEQQSEQDPTSYKKGLVRHRDFDHQIIVIGRKRSGKSEWAIALCLEFARIPCFIVAHDLGWKIPETLHDGTPTGVKRFSTAAQARAAIQSDPTGIFAISSPNAREVFQLAKDVASASLKANGGNEGNPVILYIDEIVSANICDPNYLDPDFQQLMAEARHFHVGIIAGCQSARILNNKLLTLATHVQLFRITDGRDHQRLIECGISKEEATATRALNPHESFTVKL